MPEVEATTNEVLNVKLDYIQRDIAVIKSDVKEIKSDYISRREHDEIIKNLKKEFEDKITLVREEFNPAKKIVYWLIGIFGVAIAGAAAKLLIK